MPYPYVLLSAAVSLDGCLDDTGPERLLLSSPADFDRVDEVRASVDAILIGAGTIRADNPRLLVNSPERRAARTAEGRPAYPLKVTVTATGDLDPAANFWHTGGEKLVYTTGEGAERASRVLGRTADVVSLGPGLDWRALLAHLHDVRGVRRLMVEGGGTVHTQLLQQGLADELQLVLAPLFVGDPAAPRLFGPGAYQGGRLRLIETRRIEDVVLMRYEPTAPGAGPVAAADHHWLRTACDLAALCPPSGTAFSVGAVVVAADGTELARGHSREGGDPVVHAEEAALAKIDPADPRLPGATVYSSLEPCSRRASRPAPCAELILRAGVGRVVTAWREPDTFVAAADGSGVLLTAGVDVVLLPEHEGRAKAPNAHLLP
ncbi:5-amino-6-(5-phosphoribosylamino)uracil reductase [Streptomyces griseochromogenes]|uniref:Riboflavin biosynthesis protein RibD n=1 Tax=Streptomyces griseochromogenes TaxID=68214 RepID=A0A1B1BAZ6_9ACTN|nr:dihydrofolate reductase family protein [Streptomyces griseochromogenes]ANP55961.1 5-amino-6-(5-phosphoribosylamino)uracil reductase [Streptomyces griseochromogenes]MBP2051195.1 5-amino-6-(5-phosphoribosylamino)uracil reductase [Streptomyces griseochromogenes]